MNLSRHAWFWLIATAIFVAILYLLRNMLLPFVLGMAIAFLFDPIADRLERIGAPRWLATTVVLFGVVLLLVGFILLLVPLIQAQLGQLIAAVPRYIDTIRQKVLPSLEHWATEFAGGDVEQVRTALQSYVGDIASWLGSALTSILSGGLAVVNVLSVLLIAPVVAFYLLRDWDKMMSRIDSWLPRRSAATIRMLANEVDSTLAGFVRGQAMVGIFLAVFYGVTLSAVRLDYALIIGIGIGLLSFIPYVGSVTGLLAAVGVAFGQYEHGYMVWIVVGIFLLGQVLEGNVVQPMLVGDRVGLHPVWIIFALLAGGSLFGFLGVLLAVPVAAVIGVLVRFGLGRYLESPFYRELGPGSENVTIVVSTQPPRDIS